MKTTTKQTVNHNANIEQATKPLLLMFAVYGALFLTWLTLQLLK